MPSNAASSERGILVVACFYNSHGCVGHSENTKVERGVPIQKTAGILQESGRNRFDGHHTKSEKLVLSSTWVTVS